MIEILLPVGVVALLWAFSGSDDKKGDDKKGDDKKKVVVPPPMPPNGVYPDAGMTLKRAQEILISIGYDLGKSGADGIYGPATRAALLAYQEKKGLQKHGYLDKPTADMLAAETSAAPKPTWKDIGFQRGYQDAYSSQGRFYNAMGACSDEGAMTGSGCDDGFKTGYDNGHAQGGYDRGYSEGLTEQPSADSGGSASYVKGFSDAKAKIAGPKPSSTESSVPPDSTEETSVDSPSDSSSEDVLSEEDKKLLYETTGVTGVRSGAMYNAVRGHHRRF